MCRHQEENPQNCLQNRHYLKFIFYINKYIKLNKKRHKSMLIYDIWVADKTIISLNGFVNSSLSLPVASFFSKCLKLI